MHTFLLRIKNIKYIFYLTLENGWFLENFYNLIAKGTIEKCIHSIDRIINVENKVTVIIAPATIVRLHS